MFNLLFQLSPPAACLVNETIDYVGTQFAHHLSQAANTGAEAELFVWARLDAMECGGELRKLKEKVRDLEAQVESLKQYPGSECCCSLRFSTSRPTRFALNAMPI
ncbi:uncharacterized protein LOC115996405 isoform X2 [Ipomoea triloba]|uniref:uncharacterized protein LOC115996405 isoform X2 n=1 Tax=Ipomoea triloba TaxID=35885 RepID=UPI00125D12CE|nr:uncharacterized protein LOC115996405 isoform X2 [Ipomoea triloba]